MLNSANCSSFISSSNLVSSIYLQLRKEYKHIFCVFSRKQEFQVTCLYMENKSINYSGKQVVSPDVLFEWSCFARIESRFARSMKSFCPSLFLLDLRIKRNKSSSRFFLIDLMMSLTQINRRKSCVNIPHSKRDVHKHKCTVWTLSPGETTSYCRRNDSWSRRNNSG